MTFEVELNGRTRSISIERADGSDRFRVTVDGHATLVDVQRTGQFGLSMLFPEDTHGELLAYLGGRTVPVVVNGRRTGRAAADTGEGALGEQKVAAPMPGRVVR